MTKNKAGSKNRKQWDKPRIGHVILEKRAAREVVDADSLQEIQRQYFTDQVNKTAL